MTVEKWTSLKDFHSHKGPSLYYVRVVQKMAIIMNYVMKISVRRGWVVLKSLKHPYVLYKDDPKVNLILISDSDFENFLILMAIMIIRTR